ncbi:MAG: hypothetical protein IKO76_09275 [Butyrivibrio sp.]|nr:hypothetical protein [Butyrivibrio sp.]
MERGSSGHLEESMNLRSFYLRLIRKIWIVPVAMIVGAIIGWGIYTLATVTFGPARKYSADATLYISFAYDENKGTLVDYYNAFTWNTLMRTDAIMEPIIEDLEKNGIDIISDEVSSVANGSGSGNIIFMDELKESIDADIPSDVRVMVLTVTHANKDFSNKIMKACVKSLENYGVINGAFDSIKRLGENEARLVVYTDRTQVAIIFGAICALVLAILGLMLFDVLDDSIYVPEDAEKRYKISVLGTLFKGSKDKDEFFRNELIAAFREAVAGKEQIAVISSDSVKDDAVSKKDCEALEETLGTTLKDMNYKLLPMAVPGSVLDNYRKIGTCDGAILFVPYGTANGAITEHIIAQLKKHDCPVLGVVLVRADRAFLYRYYGLAGKKNG